MQIINPFSLFRFNTSFVQHKEGSMASNSKLVTLLVLVFCLMVTNARTILPSQTMDEVSKRTEEITVELGIVKNSQFCKLCEQYSSEALDYLTRNETQTEIISALYLVCSKLDYLEQQCTTLVDNYVSLLFEEVKNISPDDLCDKFKLCKGDASFTLIEGDNYKLIKKENMPVESKNSQWCQICEKIAMDAQSYLEKNQTKNEIITFLHQDCAKLENFEEECLALVDYYSPLLFAEIETISPEQFCEKFHFCISEISPTTVIRKKIEQLSEDTCSTCEEVIEQITTKLKDPDTQFEILEILLEGCKKADNYAKQCKKLVLEYGPLILSNLEKFLEKNDLCTVIRACKASNKNFLRHVDMASV